MRVYGFVMEILWEEDNFIWKMYNIIQEKVETLKM